MTTDEECATTSWFDQKKLIGAIIIVGGAIGGGSLVGYTVEPASTTELRVENATLVERASHLEAQVASLETRVEVLEELIDDCRDAVAASRRMIGGG